MNKLDIKWMALQPLTGGFYLGCAEAIGHGSKAIVSFPGLRNVSYDTNKNPTSVSNEHYLETYLNKYGAMPPYYTFKHNMFDKDRYEDGDIDETFENIDIVMGLPVCSGLSNVTSTGSKETRNSRNNNMKYIAHYVLTQIKPKVYVFENAPGFMGEQAGELRQWFEELAEETDYSILYYKTDTCLHNNCQKRPRTFIIFSKTSGAMKFDFENSHIDTKEFFENMKKSPHNNEKVSTSIGNPEMLEFLKDKFGKDWRKEVKGDLLKYVLKNNLQQDYLDFIGTDHPDYKKIEKYINHVEYKLSIGKNYYNNSYFIPRDEHFSSVQFRSMPMMLHPIEDRTCTVRELLNLMGMPSDFEWYGNDSNLPKIGQNVPVKTAKFIIEQILKCLDENIYFDNKVVYQDNIKQKTYIVK